VKQVLVIGFPAVFGSGFVRSRIAELLASNFTLRSPKLGQLVCIPIVKFRFLISIKEYVTPGLVRLLKRGLVLIVAAQITDSSWLASLTTCR